MGAYAEVQLALNAVSASLLRYGDQCPALSGLPLEWMGSVLLDWRVKASVYTQKEAGFAYTFIALLRAEPRNVTSALCPYGRPDRLLSFAEQGMAAPASTSTGSGSGSGIHWSTCKSMH